MFVDEVQVIGAWLSPGCYRGQYLDEVPNSRSHAVMSCTQYVLGIDAEGGFALSRVVKGGRLRQMSCARGRLVPSSRQTMDLRFERDQREAMCLVFGEDRRVYLQALCQVHGKIVLQLLPIF